MKIRKEFNELATILNTAPCMFSDYFGMSPTRIERLLFIRGQIRKDETIENAIIRNYGKEVFDKCVDLIGVCPFENETKGDNDEK